jgi:lipopolysaccharide export system protein LptA
MSLHRTALALLLLAGLAIPAAFGASPAAAPDSGPTSATLPGSDKITISGDHFVIEDDKHQATFSGNVVTVQAQVTVHSDKVVTFYGKGGAGNITTFQATGHVRLSTKEQTATGDLAVFDPRTHLLTLTGNVVVTNPTGQVQSTQLVVDLKTKKSVFTSKGGRVTGVFTSQ